MLETKMPRRDALARLAAGLAAFPLAGPVQAADFPTKPVRFLTPFPPGSN